MQRKFIRLPELRTDIDLGNAGGNGVENVLVLNSGAAVQHKRNAGCPVELCHVRNVDFGFRLFLVTDSLGDCEDAASASAVCEKLNEAFDLPVKDGSSSMFASSGIEVMKTMFKGKNGHIAIRTNSVELAVAELAKKGFAYDESSAKCKNGRMTVAYLKDEFGGFAVHLLQK